MFLNKDDLTNGSINFKYQGHLGPETKTKKAGGTYEVYTFQLETTSNSQVAQYFIFKQSAEYGKEGSRLIDCSKGDTIQAYMNDQWVNWRVLDNESEPSSIQSKASENSRQVKSENDLSNNINKEVVSRILCTYIGAAISSGKTPMEAEEIAEDAYFRQIDLVKKIVSL